MWVKSMSRGRLKCVTLDARRLLIKYDTLKIIYLVKPVKDNEKKKRIQIERCAYFSQH